MNRFNYLAKARRPSSVGRIAIDNRIRGPLAALFGTVVVTGLVCSVQFARLHTAQLAYAAAATRLTADESRLNEIKALRGRVIRASRLGHEVSAMRRASLLHANELAWIGNRLPPRTWLAALRYEAGTYSLEGTSDRAASIGSVLIALHDPAYAATPQLVSLSDDTTAAGARFRYRLKLQTQP